MSGQAQIVIDKVNNTYRPPRGRPVPALADVSLEVRPREFLALLGPSGCGKSTLLYLVGGFLPTERGRIEVEGKPVSAPMEKATRVQAANANPRRSNNPGLSGSSVISAVLVRDCALPMTKYGW